MPRFPRDAPKARVLSALAQLGFAVLREGNHIALRRRNSDGTETPMTIPNHHYIYAPLREHKLIKNYPSEGWWYDPTIIEEELKTVAYDVILVDGPPGPNRAGLIKYWTLFESNVLWIFDDMNRNAEKKIIHGISGRVGRTYTIFNAWSGRKPFGVIFDWDQTRDLYYD